MTPSTGESRRYGDLTRVASEVARATGDAIAIQDVEIITRKKGRANFATKADHAAERAIIDALSVATPGVPVLAEESAREDLKGAERLWVVDPIDGTLNFSRAIPFYCLAIGYLEGGRTRAAAVYAPRSGELFAASEGGGATLNGRPITVADPRNLDECFAVTSLAYRGTLKRRSRFVALNRVCARLRVIGSAALEMCYVAAGRFDLFVHESLGPWDIAAAWLIVREAGGAVADLADGRPAGSLTRRVCAGHPAVVRDALGSIPELLEPANRRGRGVRKAT
jgi:myo-inositol-1(or 4)-monophosphatase